MEEKSQNPKPDLPPTPPKTERGEESKIETLPKATLVVSPPPASAQQAGATPALHESVWANAKVFARRIMRSNFLVDGVTEAERNELEADGVNSPTSQNYLAWRRSLLWFSSVALGFTLIFGLGSRFKDFDANPGILQFVFVMLFLAEAAACGLAVLAAVRWTTVGSTRSFARFSWLCLFAVPLLLFLIPLGKFIDKKDFASPDQAMLFSVTMGFAYFITLAPKIIGLFPALIRSSLTLKTLLPESPMPGWIAVVIAPLYTLFFLLLLVIAAQVDNLLLVVCLTALAIAPMQIALNVNRLVQPCSDEEALANIRYVRKKTWLANGVGIGAGLMFAIDILADKQIPINFMDVALFVFSLMASFLLLTVVTSDLLLGLFKSAFERENAMRSGELAGDLEGRFGDLDALGLTDVQAGEMAFLSSLGKRIKGGSNPPSPPTPPED